MVSTLGNIKSEWQLQNRIYTLVFGDLFIYLFLKNHIRVFFYLYGSLDFDQIPDYDI